MGEFDDVVEQVLSAKNPAPVGDAGTTDTSMSVPEMIADSPNLAGAYGAVKETGLSVGRAIKNTPGSLADNVGAILSTIAHPVETAKGIGNLAAGGVQKLIPGEQGKEKYADALGGFIAEKYGTPEKFRKYFEEDPVGVASDLSSVLLGGGGVVTGAGKLSKIDKITDAGRAVAQAGARVEPLGIVGSGAKKAISSIIPEGKAAKMYQRAAKFSTVLDDDQKTRMAQTAVDKELTLDSKGLNKAKGLINDLNDKISTKVDALTANGQMLNSDDLFRFIDDLRKDHNLSGDPAKNQRAIDRIEKSIRSGIDAQNGGSKLLTPSEVQKLKVNIYKDAYHKNKPTGMRGGEEAQKEIARAAREDLQTLDPSLEALNRQDGDLLELLSHLNRSVGRVENLNPVGIGVPIKMGAGGAVGGLMGGTTGAAVGTGAGLIFGLLDNPKILSQLSFLVNKAKKADTSASYLRSLARNANVQAGRLQQKNQQEVNQ